jgi:integrase
VPRPKRPARKQRLTELTIRKLAAGPADYLVWDTLQHGLALKVTPAGAKSWKCIYSRQGRARWLHLGDARSIGLADARTMAAEAMLEVARGKDPAAEKRAERGAGTFAELAAQYVERYAKKKNKSWKQADALVRTHLLPRWGKLQATLITRADVKAMMARIEAPVLANQVLAAASAIFTWAMKEEVGTTVNPCLGVDRNAVKSRERVLSDSEVPRFWSAFNDAGLLRSSALKLILLTGQRPGEVSNMRREHIVDGWWEMPGEPVPALGWCGTKNGQTHRVWLPTVAREIIAELGDETDGFVFASRRGGGAITKLAAAMQRVCAKLGVERATPHDLRRTFSTKVTGLGFGRGGLNRVTNHKEGGIADVYDRHQYSDENKRIMESVASSIMVLVEGEPKGKVVRLRR